MFGIAWVLIRECACGKKPEATKRKKVQQGSAFNEIEITSKAFESKENTVGQAGIASFSVADGHSNVPPYSEEVMEGK